MKCEWVILETEEEQVAEISAKQCIDPLLARILVNNGIVAEEEIRQYLHPEEVDFFDPFLLKDMDKLVQVLLDIRKNGEEIVVYGDYDVDGVTSTTMVYSILKRLGWKVDYYIPSRLEEGYGLSKAAIMELFHKGVRNIMTVDCGISSFSEVEYANFLQFKVIITDHHEVQDRLPPAVAVVNPKRMDDTYPDKGLAGVGVAFKVMDALLRRLGNPVDIMEYLDLVTLGTVADIVPLRGENRVIVRKGLASLANTKRLGLKKLMQISGINLQQIVTHDIGFKIAPKLNAVGRLESATAALRLLLSEDEEEAMELARYLLSQNSRRQAIENQIYREAEAQLREHPEFEKLPVLVLAREDWHPGVIGIVSSRLAAKYYKPTLMISLDPLEKVGRGSARSIEPVNIMEMFNRVPGVFEEYGGHPMAAGFTIPSGAVDQLREGITQAYVSMYKDQEFTSKIFVDATLRVGDIDDNLMQTISLLRPFGQCNHEPLFLIRDVSIDRLKMLGNRSQHLRMILKQDDKQLDAIGFNLSERVEDFRYIRPNLLRADVVGTIKTLWHYGVKHVQLFLRDIQFSIDPSFKEEEEDKTFVFGLVKNWKNQVESHKFQDLKVLKTEFAHKLKGRHPSFSRVIDSPGNVGIFANLKVQEMLLILRLIQGKEKGQRVVLVSPSNLLLSHRFQVLRRFDWLESAYLNSLNGDGSGFDVVFATLPLFLRKAKMFREEFGQWILLDPEFLLSPKMDRQDLFEQMGQQVAEFGGDVLVLGTQLSPGQKDLVKKHLHLGSFLIEHIHPHRCGLVDKRNISDPKAYIASLVQNNPFVAVVINSNSGTVELTRTFGKELGEFFHNGEVVFYNQKLKPFQRTRIEELVSEGKVRLFFTTPQFGGTMQFPKGANVCILDAPLNPLEIYTLNNALDRNAPQSILHLLFRNQQITKYQQSFSELFPDEEKIHSMLKILSSNGFQDPTSIQRSLVDAKLMQPSQWKIFAKTFEELGFLEGEKVHHVPLEELQGRLGSLLRVQEGRMDRQLVQLFGQFFLQARGRQILEIMENPLKPLL
ncbi:MAG TPA: single-stranded-DNA-specific exonuclease RecJ [Thermotogota bacterium]|nr:single-stranded-DNA-specific exonuclease RecJ [Thermotogota bacterium]HRW91973.1 single-stranded-DNA-specific exonuclease RecJ [Thermotogota bacterium]